jgi:hypothetical protein
MVHTCDLVLHTTQLNGRQPRERATPLQGNEARASAAKAYKAEPSNNPPTSCDTMPRTGRRRSACAPPWPSPPGRPPGGRAPLWIQRLSTRLIMHTSQSHRVYDHQLDMFKDGHNQGLSPEAIEDARLTARVGLRHRDGLQAAARNHRTQALVIQRGFSNNKHTGKLEDCFQGDHFMDREGDHGIRFKPESASCLPRHEAEALKLCFHD